MSPEANFGPWSTSVDDCERLARWRSLRALVAVFCGSDHPLSRALVAAERGDADAAELALDELDKLAPLRRRHVLSTYNALGRSARDSVDAGGPKRGAAADAAKNGAGAPD